MNACTADRQSARDFDVERKKVRLSDEHAAGVAVAYVQEAPAWTVRDKTRLPCDLDAVLSSIRRTPV